MENNRPANPLLEVAHLTVSFADVEVVKGLSFNLYAGEILALVGESGSGKSVTARALVGLAGEKASVDAQRLRLTTVDGKAQDLLASGDPQWKALRGKEIGFVLQDALTSLDPLRTIGQEVAEALQLHRRVPRRDIDRQVAGLLTSAGIPDPHHRMQQYSHQLSGGLRQRALIASALAAGPQMLIADEPTTALDVTVQQHILFLFRQLADRGHAVLLITHDLSVVSQIADRVLVMQQGIGVEQGEAAQVLAAPQHPYTRKLLSAIPGVHTRHRWLSTSGNVPDPRMKAASEQVVLRADRLSLAYPSSDGTTHEILKQVSLLLRRGETLGLVGESGCGKTTLGKILLALQSPHSGEVRLNNQAWSSMSEKQRRPLRGRIQTITQDPLGSFNPQYTIGQIIRQPLKLIPGLNREEIESKILLLMKQVGLSPELLTRRPQTLSGGQLQRVAIAQALASDPDIMICDEPVSALDVTTQAQVLDLLKTLQHQLGLAILLISHDPGVVLHMSHRVIVMKDGEIIETGEAEALIAQPKQDYTRQLFTAIIKKISS